MFGTSRHQFLLSRHFVLTAVFPCFGTAWFPRVCASLLYEGLFPCWALRSLDFGLLLFLWCAAILVAVMCFLFYVPALCVDGCLFFVVLSFFFSPGLCVRLSVFRVLGKALYRGASQRFPLR